MTDFYRIKRLPPYVFEQVNRIKAAARAQGADIIDLGMGNPDLPAPAHVVQKLCETAGKPRTDRYSASKGIPVCPRLLSAGPRRQRPGYLTELSHFPLDKIKCRGYTPRSKPTPDELSPKRAGVLADKAGRRGLGKSGDFSGCSTGQLRPERGFAVVRSRLAGGNLESSGFS